jgi:taurine dioxygenase
MTTLFAEASTAASRPTSPPSGWAVHDLHAPLGALVTGLDASRPLHAEQALAVKKALRDRHIVVFHQQHLDDTQFLRLARTFGDVFQPPSDVPVLASDPYGGNTPAIVKVSNVDQGVLGNHELSAHSDHHWTPVPSSGSLLYALEVPRVGGETTWINLAGAYDALDDATKREIDGLQLITYNPFLRRLKPLDSGEFPRYRTPDIEPLTPFEAHPLVRTHPESGRKILYLDEATEVELVGVHAARGRALIERLRAHLLQSRFAYSHRWEVGDIVYWDNQATLHSRTAFDASQRRVLKRISLAGSRPF